MLGPNQMLWASALVAIAMQARVKAKLLSFIGTP
jgi:hypothetical protein